MFCHGLQKHPLAHAVAKFAVTDFRIFQSQWFPTRKKIFSRRKFYEFKGGIHTLKILLCSRIFNNRPYFVLALIIFCSEDKKKGSMDSSI